MFYVLMRIEDKKFVTPAGSHKSYSSRLQDANLFTTRQEAEKHKCGNEVLLTLEEATRYR